MQPDPIGYAGGSNLYAYVNNDPLNAVDRSGLAVESNGYDFSYGPVQVAGGGGVRSRATGPRSYGIEAGGVEMRYQEALGKIRAIDPNYRGAAGVGPAGAPRSEGEVRVLQQELTRLQDAARETTTVIGRTNDLSNLGAGERSLLDRLPNQGSPQANWTQNASVLRQVMSLGRPIRDASPGDTGGSFLNAERNLLREHGWRYDAPTGYWLPPR